LLVFTVGLLTLFAIAAMLHIGVGEAEWAGMTVSNLASNLATEFNIPADEEGVVINFVEEQAYSCGVREGDLLKGVNKNKVKSVKEFLKVARDTDLTQGALLDILRNRTPLYLTLYNRMGWHGMIKQYLNIPSSANKVVNNNPGGMTRVAFTRAAAVVGAELPTPGEQQAAKKILVEGHWLGMELIPLTPELVREYRIPPGTQGLLVDEISLQAAESGILAGDMLVAIDGFATPELTAFTEVTRRVKNKNSAEMLVNRRGQLLKLTISSQGPLGISQNEAAQPILPGAISPHRSMGKPCTACHIIMKSGGQLATDAGDILPSPPAITRDAMASHEYRGNCRNCHLILK
jgi:S1-C subfamily serine protease